MKTTGKLETKKCKTVTLNTELHEVVNRRLAEHPDDAYLFQTVSPRYGKRGPAMPINRRSVSRVFEKVGNQVAPKVKLGTHSMRKDRGYAMHQAGRAIESICRMLNHSHPAMTMKYIGLTKKTRSALTPSLFFNAAIALTTHVFRDISGT